MQFTLRNQIQPRAGHREAILEIGQDTAEQDSIFGQDTAEPDSMLGRTPRSQTQC